MRAYITNNEGTKYGNELKITTLGGAPKACFEFASIIHLEVKFSNCSEFSTTNLWEFGDGTTSTEMAPTHVYNSMGTYNVKLTVSKNGVSDFTEKSVVISDEIPLNNAWGFDVDGNKINDFDFLQERLGVIQVIFIQVSHQLVIMRLLLIVY